MLSILPEDHNLTINHSHYSPRLFQLLTPPLVKIHNSHSPLPKDNSLDEAQSDDSPKKIHGSPKKLDFSQSEEQNVQESPNSDPERSKRIYQSLLEEQGRKEESIIYEKRRLPLFYKHWSTGAVSRGGVVNSKNLRTRQRQEVKQIKQKLKTVDLAKEKSKLINKLSPGMIKWNLLKHVLKSIMLFQHQSAVIINESISDHINSDFFGSCSDIFIKLNPVETEVCPPCPLQSMDYLKSCSETKTSAFFSQKENCPQRVGDAFGEISNLQSDKECEIQTSVTQAPLKAAKLNPVFQGLEKKRKLDKLFNLVGEGKIQNLEEIEKIVKQDPSQQDSSYPSNLYEVHDFKHILNKKNDNNMTPLYMACQTGNLEIVKFLIQMGANPRVPAHLSEKESETPLEVAARWNFISVVSFLLNFYKFSKRELLSANACCVNKSIRGLIKKKLEEKSKSSGCFCM